MDGYQETKLITSCAATTINMPLDYFWKVLQGSSQKLFSLKKLLLALLPYVGKVTSCLWYWQFVSQFLDVANIAWWPCGMTTGFPHKWHPLWADNSCWWVVHGLNSSNGFSTGHPFNTRFRTWANIGSFAGIWSAWRGGSGKGFQTSKSPMVVGSVKSQLFL